MSPCPRCKRPNAPTRLTCLYCGATMPTPVAAPPPPVSRELPSNLDELVRRALTGGSIEAVKKALLDAPRAPEAAPRAPEAPVPAPLEEASVDPLVLPASAIQPIEPPPPSDWAIRLEATVGLLQASQQAPTRNMARSSLEQAREAIDALLHSLEISETGVVRLPSIRIPYLLVMAQLPDTPEKLAGILGCDLSTARGLIHTDYPRILLRNQNQDPLLAAAKRAMQSGLNARILSRDWLQEQPAPWCALGCTWDGAFLVKGQPLWEDRSYSPQNTLHDQVFSGVPELVVPGDVVSREQRGGRETGRMERSQLTSSGAVREFRQQVVDLYFPGETRAVRLCEGVFNQTNLPGADSSSLPISLRNYLEGLEKQGITILGRRVVTPVGEQRNAAGMRIENGWHAWEEHSRVCWWWQKQKEGAELSTPPS